MVELLKCVTEGVMINGKRGLNPRGSGECDDSNAVVGKAVEKFEG